MFLWKIWAKHFLCQFTWKIQKFYWANFCREIFQKLRYTKIKIKSYFEIRQRIIFLWFVFEKLFARRVRYFTSRKDLILRLTDSSKWPHLFLSVSHWSWGSQNYSFTKSFPFQLLAKNNKEKTKLSFYFHKFCLSWDFSKEREKKIFINFCWRKFIFIVDVLEKSFDKKGKNEGALKSASCFFISAE